MTCIYTTRQENKQEKQIISCPICWFYHKEKCVLMCSASTAAPQWKCMMGNKEKKHSRAIQEADFEASGEIMATSSVQHPSQAFIFINKGGLFRQERKAREVDEIIIKVSHFVDGEIYSRACTIQPTWHNPWFIVAVWQINSLTGWTDWHDDLQRCKRAKSPHKSFSGSLSLLLCPRVCTQEKRPGGM